LISPDAVTVPASALVPDILPPEVRALAERAFGPGHLNPSSRPEAAEWARALQRASSELSECNVEPHHVFSAHLTRCPWCARISEGRPVLFSVPPRKPKPAAARRAPAPPTQPPASGGVPSASSSSGRVAVAFAIVAILIVILLLL
jgi:hypothetical protein